MAITVSLKDLYVKGDSASVLKLLEALSLFRCKKGNDDVQDFLRKKSIIFEELNLARTYIIFDDHNLDIIGYFSIAVKVLDVCDLSKSQRKKLSAGIGDCTHVATFLVGQIGKSDKCGDRLIKYQILDTAISYIKEAQNIVGGRIIYLDCLKDLIPYYEGRGLKLLTQNDKYAQMIMPI